MGIAQQLDPSAQQRLAQTVLERTLRPTGRNKDVRWYRGYHFVAVVLRMYIWHLKMIYVYSSIF